MASYLHFVAWLAICVWLYVMLHRQPVALLMAPIAVRIIFPSVANQVLVGTNRQFVAIHAASWMLFVFFLLASIHRVGRRKAAVAASGAAVPVFVLVLFEQTITTVTQRAAHLLAAPMNAFAAPFAFFILYRMYAESEPELGRRLARPVVGLALMEAVLGIAQWQTHNVLVLEQYQALHYWFNPATFARAQGTLDSPLDLVLLLVLAAPLVSVLDRASVRLLASGLIGVGALVTSSRLGVLFVFIGILVTVGRSATVAGSRLLTRAIFAVVALASLSSVLASEFIGRVSNDAGSIGARSAAYDYFWSHIWSIGLLGGGAGSATEIQTSGTLGSSLENGYAMYAVNYGVAAALVLLLLQLTIVFNRDRKSALFAPRVAAACVIATTLFYSSFMTLSAASLLVWVAISIATGGAPASELVDTDDRALMTRSA